MRLYLNSDVGERPSALDDGSEERLIQLLDWANIACGGHAGDEDSMHRVVDLCLRHGVQVGAHPGYPDRETFGRDDLDMSAGALSEAVFEQVSALDSVCRRVGACIRHVKPHGALYNRAARDADVARAVSDGIARWQHEAVLVGLAGSAALEVWRNAGFEVAGEVFADRRYERDGSLRSRKLADSLITDPAEAARHAQLAVRGEIVSLTGERIRVDALTICVHSDTPNAAAIAEAIRAHCTYA